METSQESNAKFEGWAIVELFGHGKEAGFVKTEYFGTTAMFRVDVPELPEREWALEAPQYVGTKLIPAGSIVKKDYVPGRTRLINPSAIFALNPCSEEFARNAIAQMMPRPLQLIALNDAQRLAAAVDGVEYSPQDIGFKCCGRHPGEGHDPECENYYEEDENNGTL